MTQMRAAELVRASMLDAAISIVTVLCSLPYGTTAVAAAFAVTGLFMRTPLSYWLATRHGPVKLAQIYTSMLPSAVAGCPVVAALWALRPLLRPADTAPPFRPALAPPTPVLPPR